MVARRGKTRLDNLCSLCRRHHRYVHELGFRIVRDETGDFRFLGPDGRAVPLQETPPLGPQPIETLRARHREQGIVIDPMTSYPHGDGRRPDYADAVWSLMPGPTPAPPNGVVQNPPPAP